MVQARRARPHRVRGRLGLFSAATTFVNSTNTNQEIFMKPSTQDKVEGTAKEIAGNIKEASGRMVRNPRLESDGKTEKIEGKVQKKVGEIEKVLGC